MSSSGAFNNPIIPGFNPDPSICRVDDDYFLVTSTFEYYPGIPIYHSKDLVQWRLIGHAITKHSQINMRTTEPSGGLWAPTIRYHSGQFYVSVGCTHRFRPKDWDIVIPRGFYVSTSNIWESSSWSDPVFFDVPGIDQDLFFDDDGKVYFSAVNMIVDPRIKKHGIGLATFTTEVDIATGRSLGSAKWNRLSDFGLGIAEGPHIFKKDGYYYLSTAEGGTDEGHQQWICRSTTGPFGPWEVGPKDQVNPVIFNDNDPSIRNTGHLDFIETPNGKWFAVFLGVRPQGENSEWPSQLGRETFMSPVEWIDGWPIVNARKPISLQMQAEGTRLLSQPQTWRDNFDQPNLQLGWYRLRTPLKNDYSLSERPGYLALYGNAYRIDSSECPSMLLQKQVGFSGDWKTRLEFKPTEAGHEAGAAIWWSQFSHASIGFRKPFDENTSGFEMIARCYDEIEDQFKETKHQLSQGLNTIEIVIRAHPTRYELFFSIVDNESSGSAPIKLGEISTKTLTHRRSGKESPNTGAHFAIYAQGAYDKPCLDPAHFSFAEWKVNTMQS
ncbi:hypothetical protein N7456_004645 [Penicillium angulare]|uniref:Beta-xylosidase C-terminal Concanavalin A-like domain-containing protein n=1 Tax=Penicillium angulare TaxID=116970 RepID=A0A9W9KIS4_9EURO|nr:hypothetical protein N7456_004645 [Penicillium angulare]